jgi:predicted secreted protein
MSDNAIKAQGTVLKLGAGSPLAYTTIPEINSFNGPSGSATIIDVTDLSSTAKEKLTGLHDNGQLSFECNFIPTNAQHVALRTAKENSSMCSFQLIFSDGTTWSFNALVTGFSVSGGVDGVVKSSVTLDISGDISES